MSDSDEVDYLSVKLELTESRIPETKKLCVALPFRGDGHVEMWLPGTEEQADNEENLINLEITMQNQI